MAVKIVVYPAFYRRVRHYRYRMVHDGRAQVGTRFAEAVGELVRTLLLNPKRGRLARFEATDLSDVQRINVPDFGVFAIFYRRGGITHTVITLEHTAQDLPTRLAKLLNR